jgi:CTP:molybdopterin cytidylyltransferase MocA
MGFPKALLPFRGSSFLEHLVTVFTPECDPVIVVVGHHANVIRERVRVSSAVRFTTNPDPDRGMLSSLQCGLADLPAGISGFLFTPVDLPAVEPATVRRICDAFRNTAPPPPLVVPRHGDRRGHPVLCRASLIPDFLALPASAQARDLIHRFQGSTAYLDVEDPAILADVDFPEDYERLLAQP